MASRLDLLIDLVGGEQNFPPKLSSKPAQAAQASTNDTNIVGGVDGLPELPSVEEFLMDVSSSASVTKSSWLPPKKAQAIPSPRTQQTAGESIKSAVEWDPRKDEPAPRSINRFSPFGGVTKFCYKYVRKECQQAAASALFDSGKIWNRQWDLYYIWTDHYESAKPITFVPESQLQALIAEINIAIPEARVSGTTKDLLEEDLSIDFSDQPQHLRPYFLGCSTTRDQHDYWVAALPPPSSVSHDMADDPQVTAFKQKVAAAAEVSKNKSKAKKKLALQQRTVSRQEMSKSLLRVQAYLGLLPKNDESPEWNLGRLSLSAIDVTKPSPHEYDREPIIISIDVEAHERMPSAITEVGVATLDTRDLKGIPPGRVGADWQRLIRARHFRIEEYRNHCNHKFVRGCPDAFEFGQSEFVKRDNITSILASCFHEPFSKPAPPGSYDRDFPALAPRAEVVVDDADPPEPRHLILLGHDLSQDINYLRKLGFDATARGNLIDRLDTVDLFRAYTRDPNPRALGGVLDAYGLVGWHMHNAGNDAVYTLWAMLAVAVQDARERGGDAAGEVEGPSGALVRDAVEGEGEGWELEPGDDGGKGIPPSAGDFMTKKDREAAIEAFLDADGPVEFESARPSELSEGHEGDDTMGGVPLDV